MMDDDKLRSLWQGVRVADVRVEEKRLLASLNRRTRQFEWRMRRADLWDLRGGAALLVIVAILALEDPSWLRSVSPSDWLGVTAVGGACLYYHVQAYRSRRRRVPLSATYVELLEQDRDNLSRRIQLLASVRWVAAAFALGTPFALWSLEIHPAGRVLLIAVVAAAAFGVSRLAGRARAQEALPLRASIEELLGAVRAGDGPEPRNPS